MVTSLIISGTVISAIFIYKMFNPIPLYYSIPLICGIALFMGYISMKKVSDI